MIPVVSEKYRYIFFYNPKSACSVARKLFLELHREELSLEHQAILADLRAKHQDEWHSVNEMFPLKRDFDYQDYFKFTLVRHPAMRTISAYLNRIVLKMTDQDKIAQGLREYDDTTDEVTYSFDQFLQYLRTVPLEQVDNLHFLPQSFLMPPLDGSKLVTYRGGYLGKKLEEFRRSFSQQEQEVLVLDGVCKIESLQTDLLGVYSKIFRQDRAKLEQAKSLIAELSLHNSTYVSEHRRADASSVPAAELREEGQMPNYQSFLTEVNLEKIGELFAEDFRLFNYDLDPAGKVLGFEKSKHQTVRDTVPEDFEWSRYVELNPDLSFNGIASKADAVNHWIHHGRFEDRQYR